MKYKILNSINNFPALIVDDWYNAEEEQCVWKELNFYTNKRTLLRSEQDITTATNKEGESLVKSFRIYPDLIYNPQYRNQSNICYYTEKFRKKEFHSLVSESFGPIYRMFQNTNSEKTLISYYENKDYYNEHCDIFAFTLLIWFYRQPKKYKGGDLVLTESNCTVENIHNRLIMFPSYYLHKVTPVDFKNSTEEIGFGRYTITHFFYTTPQR